MRTRQYRKEIRKILARGVSALENLPSLTDFFSAEILDAQCYGGLPISLQYGTVGYTNSMRIYQTILRSKPVSMVRIEWLDPIAIIEARKAGAYGILCPMVNTAEDAARLVLYKRNSMDSVRSLRPDRAGFHTSSEGKFQTEDELLAFAVVETSEARKNLTSIAATPGLDGLYIGASDLTISLTGRQSHDDFDQSAREMDAVTTEVLTVAHDAGILAALHCHTARDARRGCAAGFDIVIVSDDARPSICSGIHSEQRQSLTWPTALGHALTPAPSFVVQPSSYVPRRTSSR